MAKFRKKPVEIDAIQFLGTKENVDEIRKLNPEIIWHLNQNLLTIPTLEGDMTAQLNDWIIKGIKGETYPCKPDVFEKTYESVE
jgi:hypothetical protein